MGKCTSETFYLESDQSLPLELAKHDLFGRPDVVFGVCIALRDLVYPFSPTVVSLELEGGGGRIEDLMVLLRIFHRRQKVKYSQTNWLRLLLRRSDGVSIPLPSITVRINIWCLCEKFLEAIITLCGEHFVPPL